LQASAIPIGRPPPSPLAGLRHPHWQEKPEHPGVPEHLPAHPSAHPSALAGESSMPGGMPWGKTGSQGDPSCSDTEKSGKPGRQKPRRSAVSG